MKKQIPLLLLLFVTVIYSCKQKNENQQVKSTIQDSTLQDSTPKKEQINYHPLTYAAIYQELAAEKYALEYQAYALAKMALKQDLLDESIDEQRAVILDIDETVLDNSPYEAMIVKKDTSYPYRWAEWLNKADARPLAGVKDFLEYAVGYGVDIFYITNRKEKFRDVTLKNLEKHKLPQAESDHLLMRTETSSKTKRREKVQENYHIALLIGDNLNDFSDIFEGKSNKQKKRLIDEHQEMFGTRFIMLPNATYGDWESAIYNYNYSLSEEEKHKKRMKSLEGF